MLLPDRDALYGLVERWRNDCLIGDGSLLDPGRPVWSLETLTDWRRRFIEEPDPTTGSFVEKLPAQAAGASQDVRLLVAELRLMQLLPMAKVSAASKRDLVQQVLDALDVAAAFPDDVLAAFADPGLASYGAATTHLYAHLSLLTDRGHALKQLDPRDRAAVLADPARWKELVYASAVKAAQSQANMLLHLGRPEAFEPIISSADKRRIVKALGQPDDPSDIDQALHVIHERLIESHGRVLHLYHPDVRRLWHPDAIAKAEAEEAVAELDQVWTSWVIDRFVARGGQPTLPADSGLPQRVRAWLDELESTGDIDAWLAHLREDPTVMRNLTSGGAHHLAHRAIVREAEDPRAAAQILAQCLRAPRSDEEASQRISRLQPLIPRGHVGAALVCSNVWHLQDPSIPPVWIAVEVPLRRRGWYAVDDDQATRYLRYAERLGALGDDPSLLVPAISAVDDPASPLRLAALHRSAVERCAMAAEADHVSLAPVRADLDTLLEVIRDALGLPESLTTARSRLDGTSVVWAELRQDAHTVLRLRVAADGVVVARPAHGAGPDDLATLDGLPGLPDARWEGVVLSAEEGEDPEVLVDAARRVARLPTDAADRLSERFEEFRRTHAMPTPVAQAEADRRELARHLTAEALRDPSLDGLRKIINSNKYGLTGPMSQLNRTLNEAAAEGRLPELGRVFSELCHGEGTMAERIDAALAATVPGLGEAVIMKMLAITHPDQIIPIWPLTGPKGKVAALESLGLPPPAQGSRGARQIAANDALVAHLRHLSDSLWELKDFCYWTMGVFEDPGAVEGAEDRLANVARECHLPEEWLDEVVALLREPGKPQAIFYGPPGTGKTFVAMKLAEALSAGGGTHRLVQFHPSYGYEDFFEGFRPRSQDGTLTYELVAGPLREMAEAARGSHATHVLVIDEINRANLPKVFGELLFLLEYRDQEVKTMYGGEPFSLPPNLIVIGTMNTADRSIALVDAAMRRRFHFVPFFPDRTPVLGVLERWLEERKLSTVVAHLVDRVNAELVERLGGPDMQIGPSHFMRVDIQDALPRVWRYSIEPLIEEQLFGDTEAINHFRYDAVLNRHGAEASGEGAADAEEAAHTEGGEDASETDEAT